jgi:hypothetical protein
MMRLTYCCFFGSNCSNEYRLVQGLVPRLLPVTDRAVFDLDDDLPAVYQCFHTYIGMSAQVVSYHAT